MQKYATLRKHTIFNIYSHKDAFSFYIPSGKRGIIFVGPLSFDIFSASCEQVANVFKVLED
jgi:hypothetical protein